MRKNPKHSVQMIFRKRIDFIIFLALSLFITKPSKGDLTKEVDNQLGEMGDIGVLSEQKKKLFDELDSLLLETYQTTPVLIDDTRLVAGEEGSLISIDLEFIKNNNKEGLFDPRKISESTQERITSRIEEIGKSIIQ